MKTKTMDKLCASYMEDARALKRKFPNRELVLRLIEDAYKGIKPLGWRLKSMKCWLARL